MNPPSRRTVIIVIVILVVLAYAAFIFDVPYKKTVDDFTTCAASGRPILMTYPEQCVGPDGTTYTQPTAPATTTADKIFLESPASGAKISSPVELSGQARGPWYFEAVFPIQIIGTNGAVLGSGQGRAGSDWMTKDFVPFTAAISFNAGSSTAGFIRLKNDNASGATSTAEQIDIPVTFAASTTITTSP